MNDDVPPPYRPLPDAPRVAPAVPRLLAVDLGLVSGWATFDASGRVVLIRSSKFPDVGRLKRAVYDLVPETVTHVFVEGDRHLGEIWGKAAKKRGARLYPVSPERWRKRLLHPREMRSGAEAKAAAEAMATRILAWSGTPSKTTVKTDTAEAILIGLYGVLKLGWLHAVPPEVERRV